MVDPPDMNYPPRGLRPTALTELSIDFGRGEMNSIGRYAQHLIEARPMPDLMGRK
jgi:hypothetical protein